MNNKLHVLTLLLLVTCTTTIKKQLQVLTSWNVIDGIMIENWSKDRIGSILGQSGKVLPDGTHLYFDQDTKMQTFAIEYESDGQIVNFSFKPQENEVTEFSIDKIKTRWKNFNCVEKSEQVVHPDYIENKYRLECPNHATAYFSKKKEISYLIFTRK